MIKNELQRFLYTLNNGETSIEVRKIANLIFNNAKVLEPLGTAHSLRSKKIIELLQNWDTLPDAILEKGSNHNNDTQAIKSIESIKVGPFRGFAKEENLNINSLRVLIYGPNGTGKTSFCEALEFGLLGSVEEAQSNRFSSTQYLKNAHVNRYVPPEILGKNNKNEIVSVDQNESLYRFCFVEKNRIDNFSRIAAQAPAKQTELISSLFGLEHFNNFVKNFSREIDDRYIDLTGEKSALLTKKQQQLVIHNNAIIENDKSLKLTITKQEELAKEFSSAMTFQEMLLTLGSDETPGEIQKIEKELQENIPEVTDLLVINLEKIKNNIETTYAELEIISKSLQLASESLSFKQLYTAVCDLQNTNEAHCPACKTPVEKTVTNPFLFAEIELKKLKHLSLLEADQARKKNQLSTSLQSLHSILSKCIKYSEVDNNILHSYRRNDPHSLDKKWWLSLFENFEGSSPWQLLIHQIQILELRDTQSRIANTEKNHKQRQLKRAREFKEKAMVLQTKYETYSGIIEKANLAITTFTKENEGLINDVELERPIIEKNKKIATAYQQFIALLIAYKEQLPNALVADLGELVTKFYNAFNRYDDDKELLSEIKLPLVSGDHIEISYKSSPDNFFNALHILSEGHIRCIGLSILLAKNIKSNSPFIIFDDPVNAIDDEHRKAIRETLYIDDFFKEKQIILTCHGEEFLKNIHQEIGSKASKESSTYKFLPQRGEMHIQISSFSSPPNYVLAATSYLENAEYRDALASARRALEYLSEKTWAHYSKHCHKTDDSISISKRSPHAPHDLRNLVENLISKINKSKANIPNKEIIIASLTLLLGTRGDAPPWVYLNKGTHEESDRDEFEPNTVQSIVSSLQNLDEALKVK